MSRVLTVLCALTCCSCGPQPERGPQEVDVVIHWPEERSVPVAPMRVPDKFDMYESIRYPKVPPPGFVMLVSDDGMWNYRDANGVMRPENGFDSREHAIWWAWSWYEFKGGFRPATPRAFHEADKQ